MPAKTYLNINLTERPDILALLNRLHEKTGLRSSAEVIRMALTQMDAALPAEPANVNQPDNSPRP